MRLAHRCIGLGANHPLSQFRKTIKSSTIDDCFSGHELQIEELKIMLVYVTDDSLIINVEDKCRLVYDATVYFVYGDGITEPKERICTNYCASGNWKNKIRTLYSKILS